MELENFFTNFSLNNLLAWFLPFLFLGQIVFLLIVGRQISLMDNLFKAKFDFLLKLGNWLLIGLAILGLLISLLAIL